MKIPVTRRDFIRGGAAAAAAFSIPSLLRARGANIRVGCCDWSIRKEGLVDAFALAKELGMDGLEISCGQPKTKLPILGTRLKKSLEASQETGVVIASTCLEVFHRDGLKDHPDAPKWIEQAIEATKALGAKMILLPFFGKHAIEERPEQKAVAQRLKGLGPKAEKEGILLGLEDTISAEDNARIMDECGSPAVKTYYDVGNSFVRKFDVYEEVAWLGKDRLCGIHLKEAEGLIGKGPIDFPKFIDIVVKTGYEGWLHLETPVLKDLKEEYTAHGKYVRGLLNR